MSLEALRTALSNARKDYVESLQGNLDDGIKAVIFNRFQAARLRYLDAEELERYGTRPERTS